MSNHVGRRLSRPYFYPKQYAGRKISYLNYLAYWLAQHIGFLNVVRKEKNNVWGLTVVWILIGVLADFDF